MDMAFTYGQLLSVLTLADKGAGNISAHHLVSHILRLPENNSYNSGYIPDIRYVMQQAKAQILEQYPDIRDVVEAYCEALKVHKKLNESYTEQADIDQYMMELGKIKDGTWTKEGSVYLPTPVQYGIGEYKDPKKQEKAVKQYQAEIKRKCFDLEDHWMYEDDYQKLVADHKEAVERVNRLYGTLEKALIQQFDIPEHKTYNPDAHVEYNAKLNSPFAQISDAKLAELKIDFSVLEAPLPKGWGKPRNAVDASGAEIGPKVSKKTSDWSRSKSGGDNNTGAS